jgi:hypothetical protein
MIKKQCCAIIYYEKNVLYYQCHKLINNDLCSYHSKCKNIITIDDIKNGPRLFKDKNETDLLSEIEIKKTINNCMCKITLFNTLIDNNLQFFKNIKDNKKELCKYFLNKQKKDFVAKAIIIQKNYRGYCIRKINKLLGPGLLKKSLLVNDEDIMTCDKLREIPWKYLFTLESNSKLYFFDLRTFYKFYIINMIGNEMINPYTQIIISNKDIRRFKDLIILYNYKNIKLYHDDDITPDYNSIQYINNLAFNVFQKIDLLGYYTNSDWFLNLNLIELKKLYKYMEDIWSYRAQLTIEKQKDIRPDGNAFKISVAKVYVNIDKLNVQKIILNEMIQFVTLANNRSDRFNGATYILIALCMVSKEAYEELPEWLRYTF